ncbi:calcium-binding protein [Streptomyces lasiicapitis]|uniref:calcium-binding protein n=1 Tax=Streptomyces lasiicapitis TaxID=1923961 RepID=UPI00365177B9
MHYTAAAGQANDVTITYKFRDDGSHSGLYDFTLDDRVPLTAGAGCAHPDRADRTKVVCTVPPPGDSASDLEKLIADTGDGNDRITVDPGNNAYLTLHGGKGDDTLKANGYVTLRGDAGADRTTGGGGAWGKDDIRGGRGDDKLYGDRSDDTVHGNSGNDLLRGGAGNDKLSGGPGRDDVRQN